MVGGIKVYDTPVYIANQYTNVSPKTRTDRGPREPIRDSVNKGFI